MLTVILAIICSCPVHGASPHYPYRFKNMFMVLNFYRYGTGVASVFLDKHPGSYWAILKALHSSTVEEMVIILSQMEKIRP